MGREKREVKPNQMDDHVYFTKKRNEDQVVVVSKSQLKAKRLAKQAAKDFERQKLKAQKAVPKIEAPLDFTKFSLADDDEVSNSINQMKQRIRNQSRTQLSSSLKQHKCIGDNATTEVQQIIRQFVLDIEELISKKSQIDFTI